MTDIIAYTVKDVIDEGNPQDFANALHLAGLGGVLNALSLASEVSDTGTVPASVAYYFDLTKTPVPGTLRVASAAAVLSEYVGGSAVAATQYKLSVVSGVTRVTVHSGTAGETYVAKYLTLDNCGADGATALATALALPYGAG
jgi:hypothetical protein